MALIEDPPGSGLYIAPGVAVEDPPGSGLYYFTDVELVEDPEGSGLYLVFSSSEATVAPCPRLVPAASGPADRLAVFSPCQGDC